jgi:hypothetical protein
MGFAAALREHDPGPNHDPTLSITVRIDQGLGGPCLHDGASRTEVEEFLNC